MKRLLVLPLLAVTVAACTVDEALPGQSGASSGTGSAPAPTTPPAQDAGTVIRTVMTRNPFGGPSGNLLVDGDFELSTVGSPGAQLGWRGFSADGSTNVEVNTETGGLCHSGLRCAVMEPGMLFLLRGASANGKGMIASGWGKPQKGDHCGVVELILIGCDTFTVDQQLVPETKPGADGWCRYSVSVPASSSATCVYVSNSLPPGHTALLDSVVLASDDGTVLPQAAEFWVPDALTVARLQSMRAYTTATMPLERAPSPVRAPRPTP